MWRTKSLPAIFTEPICDSSLTKGNRRRCIYFNTVRGIVAERGVEARLPHTRLNSCDANNHGGTEAVEPVMSAMQMFISAGCRSGYWTAISSPKDLKPHILASMRLQAWYPLHRFQKARLSY